MGSDTAISWTDATFNPWWGCTRVSPGCEHCYAEAFAKRTGNDVWGKGADRRLFGEKHWHEPLKWNRDAEKAGVPMLVFCASMADVFEDRPELEAERAKLWALIGETPWLTWQLLTKRPENVMRMVPVCWDEPFCHGGWPRNVWIGTTVEDQKRAQERIPHLLKVPAPVRFLSCEPLLEAVDVSWALQNLMPCWPEEHPGWEDGLTIDWVICGGESGGQRREFDLEWAVDLFDQCDAADVPFFFKQAAGLRPGTPAGNYLDQLKAIPPRWHP